MVEAWTGLVLVSGTDTGVGKTVVTAAIAAAASGNGARVAVVKPAQTGTDDDAAEVARLAGVRSVRTLARYAAALAPAAAARIAGQPLLGSDAVVAAIKDLVTTHDLVLVEGAGGLLIQIAGDGLTMAGLAQQLDAPVVVVTRAELGTLNHTALTIDALSARGIGSRVVVGSWPLRPDLVHRANLRDMPGVLAGVVTAGAAGLNVDIFRARARDWLAPELHGRLDVDAFRSAVSM